MSHLSEISGEYVCISLTPSASLAFEEKKIPYHSITSYTSDNDSSTDGLKNFNLIGQLISIVDEELRHEFPEPSLAPAKYSHYSLYILFDNLWTTISLIKKTVDIQKPDRIRLYAKPRMGMARGANALPNDQSVYAEVMRMAGWGLPIDILHAPDKVQCKSCSNRQLPLVSWVKNRVMNNDLIFNIGLISRRQGFSSAIMAAWHALLCRQKPVLIYNSGYNWDDALGELYRNGFSPVYRFRDADYVCSAGGEDIWKTRIGMIFRNHHSFREFDRILGIQISDFFFAWCTHILTTSVLESQWAYSEVRKKIRDDKICCLLHSVRDSAIGHASLQAAHDSGIPVISWQHGGAGYCYHPLMPYIEFNGSDWHFVFGEGVAGSYNKTVERLGLKDKPVFFPVGSSTLDLFSGNVKRRAKNGHGYILYVTTHYIQNVSILPQMPSPGFDEHLWTVQKQIIQLAKNNPDQEIIVKLHPMHEDGMPLTRFARENHINNIKFVVNEKSLQELLIDAKVVVLDLISTGILQVFTTDLPVFVYSGLYGKEIEPEAETLLKERAYTFGEVPGFIDAINEFIRFGSVHGQSPDVLNEEFITCYGTDIHSRDSAGRAIMKLKEILAAGVHQQ